MQIFLHFREIAAEIAKIEGIVNPDISKLAGKLSTSGFNLKKTKLIAEVLLIIQIKKLFGEVQDGKTKMAILNLNIWMTKA